MPEDQTDSKSSPHGADWAVRAVRALFDLPQVNLVQIKWWLRRGANLTPDLDAPSFALPGDVPDAVIIPAGAVQLMVAARGVAPPHVTSEMLLRQTAELLTRHAISSALAPQVTTFGTVAGERHPYAVVIWHA